MHTKWEALISEKSDAELIKIYLNSDDYQPEFVELVNREIKLRQIPESRLLLFENLTHKPEGNNNQQNEINSKVAENGNVFFTIIKVLFVLAAIGKAASFYFNDGKKWSPYSNSTDSIAKNFIFLENLVGEKKPIPKIIFKIKKLKDGYHLWTSYNPSQQSMLQIGNNVFLILPDEALENRHDFQTESQTPLFFDYSFTIADSLRKVKLLIEDRYAYIPGFRPESGKMPYIQKLNQQKLIPHDYVPLLSIDSSFTHTYSKIAASFYYSIHDSLGTNSYAGVSKIIYTGKFHTKDTYAMIDIFAESYDGFVNFAEAYFRENLWFGK